MPDLCDRSRSYSHSFLVPRTCLPPACRLPADRQGRQADESCDLLKNFYYKSEQVDYLWRLKTRI
jgi:hypothetical protein